MPSATLYRLGGIAGILAGLCLVVESILPVSPLVEAIGLLSVLLGLFALTALYLAQRESSGVMGGIGYIVNYFGLALLVGVSFAEAFIFPALSENVVEEFATGSDGLSFLVSLVIFNLGVVLFGIATILARVYSPVAAVLYMVGFLSSLVTILVSLPEIIGTIGLVAAAIGIIWLGYALWSGTKEAEGETEPEALV